MNRLKAVPLFIKKYADCILVAILLFLLLTPTSVWDREYGHLSFYFVVFPILTLLFALLCLANYIEKKRSLKKSFCNHIWLAAFTASLLVAVLASTNLLLSLTYLPYYLCGIFLVSIIYASEFTLEKIKRIFGFIAFGILITAVYAVIQRIQGVASNASFTNLAVNQNMPGRVDSVFGNPNIYAFALASLLPAVAAYTLTSQTRLRVAFGALSFMLGTAALLMTYSRGAWFGFAVGVFLFISLYKPKLIPILALLCLAALPFLPASIKNRVLTVFNPNDTSISYRGLLMNSGLQVLADRPIFGAGLGLNTVQDVVHQSYWPSDLNPIYRFYHTHNLFLQMWCEMGILGCVTFLGATVQNIVLSVKGMRKKNKTVWILSASLISGMIAMLLCGITDCPLNTLRTMLLFWILFGLLGSVRNAGEAEGQSSPAACNSTDNL